MKTPIPPLNGNTDKLLYALLTGGDCIGYNELAITDQGTTSLDGPEIAVYCLIVVEADPTTLDKTKVLRFKEVDTDLFPPTPTFGLPLGDLSVYEVKGKRNLSQFKAISIEPGKTHILRVQYYD